MGIKSDRFFKTSIIFIFLVFSPLYYSQSEWFEKESEHFTLVYKSAHVHLADKILFSAENALEPLMKIFNYTPSEKIIISTYDVSDFGFGAASTVPQNFIRLEIEPLETGYETVPYNDRIQWLLSHEIVHIVINDQASDIESFFRSAFSKVAPEQSHPITVFYSLLTNFSRYTPRWHQEAIAVFIETWFSGGYGRLLGNFDEMYFRSIVLEGSKTFPTNLSLDAKTSHNSFLLETTFYLYGARFCSYLTIKYGPEKLIEWFTAGEDQFYTGFVGKFEKVYGGNFDETWNEFIENEKQFQKENIERLSKYTPTPVKYLSDEPVGWTTRAYYNYRDSSFIFGYHQPHHVAGIQEFSLRTFSGKEISSLPSPSIQQVSSSAYDSTLNLFFYTTNNNQLYRDIWALDVDTKEKKMLFEDCRIGDITVSSVTHELWGIRHDNASSMLMYTKYPYNELIPLIGFAVGDDISQLSVDPSGKFIAAMLHRNNGDQSIIVANCDSLKNGSRFKYVTITSSGSPENPSWSSDSKTLFWNAYVNGVSNIYRCNVGSGTEPVKIPISHTLSGLFKPVELTPDSLFCFEFTSEGFRPVVIANKPADFLPAIKYLGQSIIDKYPALTKWELKEKYIEPKETEVAENKTIYSGFNNLNINAFIPVITGFQKQKVIGLFTHIADPLLIHDITAEIGYSPFNENPAGPKFHFKGRYEYKKQFDFGVDYNAPDFYDLFNNRKRGMIGTKFRLGNTHFWNFNNPLKVKQNTEIAVYTDYQFISDNLVRVSEPDFFVAQTAFNYKNSRRSIGSSDFEVGQEFTATVMLFGSDPKDPEYSGQVFSDFSNLNPWIAPHNVLHIKLGAGYCFTNERLIQGNFFFGGFGNRALENVDFKQFRSLFRFPGIPIYSLLSDRFVKLLIENNFPPIRFGNMGIGQQYINHIDFSVYSQGLVTRFDKWEKWVNAGGQINIVFKHWFNLESALSAGIARAWTGTRKSDEWFISYKLLRN